MIVYKVVRESNSLNEYTSICRRNEFPSAYRVTYKIGKITIPLVRYSMLFAFLDKKDAFQFANLLHGMVFEAETPSVIKDIEPQDIPRGDKNLCTYYFDSFWKNFSTAKKNKKKLDKTGEHPQPNFNYSSGVCCPSIKLIKRIHQ